MRAADLFQQSVKKYRKGINPPYSKKDLISILGTVLVLFVLPLTVIAVYQARSLLSRAQEPSSLEAESASLSGPVIVGSDSQASGGQYIEFGSSEISGTTYYVDCSGDDSKNGTSEASAWRTLGKAGSATLNPGDGVLLKRGCAWNATLTISRSGAASNNIVIGAYGGGALPKIERNVDGSKGVNVTGSYVTVENIHVKGIAPATEAGCSNNPKGHIVGFQLDSTSHHNTIRNVEASGNYAGVYIKLGSANNKVLDSNFHDNTMMSPLDPGGSGDAGAFGVLLHGDDNEIAHNTMSGHDACSYDYGRDGAAVEVYKGKRNKIHHNTASDNDSFSELGGDVSTKAEDNTYAYNLVTSSLNTSTFLVARGSGIDYGPTWRTKAYNNTVYLTGSASEGFVCHAGCSSQILTLKNNVIWAESKVGYADAGFDESHNLYWSSDGSPTLQFTKDSTSKIANPDFESAGSNLRLKSGSPAIDAGTNESVSEGFSSDLDGNSVPQGSAPDMGAYEFVSAQAGLKQNILSSARSLLNRTGDIFSGFFEKQPKAFAQTEPNEAVKAAAETDPVHNSGDAADDSAIWRNSSNPSQSLVIGTDKLGGLAVYNLSGSELHYYSVGRPNNVDLRYGFQLSGNPIDIVAASERDSDTILLYRVDQATNGLVDVRAVARGTGIGVAGLCMYKSPATNKYYVFVGDSSGTVKQFELSDNGAGKVDYQSVRTLSLSSVTEGCVADDTHQKLYVAQEDVAIWSFGAEPDSGTSGTRIADVGDHLTADIEGLAIYTKAGGSGYLIASSQGSDDFAVFDRVSHAYLGRFSITAGTVDGVDHTDGIDVTSSSLGSSYPDGLFIAQDNTNGSSNQNFKLVSWQIIAGALGLGGGGSDAESPTTPTSLQAVVASSSKVDLTWTASTDNVGVTGYKIYRNGGATSIGTSPTNSYSDTTVSPSTTYTYEVSAYDAATNESDKSSSASVTTPCAGPPTDKGVAALTFNLSAGGNYKIWSRIRAPDNTKNSYYLQVDDNCGTVVGDSSITTDAWAWVDYQDGDSSSKVTFDLASGNHTMNLIGRESGVRVDKLIITGDFACVPTGTGENCLGGSPPPPTSFRFVSWGDSRSGFPDLAVLSNQAKALNPDLTVFTGDLEPDGFTLAGMSDWKKAINGDTSGAINNGIFDKTLPVRGNHDSSDTSGWQSYFDTAATVTKVGGTNYSYLNNDLTYSFDYGNSHFVGIDNLGSVDEISSAQISWLDSDLTAAESRGLTHAFIYWHGPIFAIDGHCCPDAPSSLITVLNDHPIVSATFHGHEHVTGYVHIDSSRISAVTHPFEEFVTGSAGAPLYSCRSGRSDWCHSANSFITIDVSGATFTVNAYRQGTASPVKTWAFTKGTSDSEDPTVSITSPTEGATVSGTVNIQATASDNVAVSRVEFYVGSELKGTDNTEPYEYSWDSTTVGDRSHTLQAKAFDTSNNSATDEVIVTTDNNIQTFTFTPADDATVRSDSSSSNYGSAASLEVDNSPMYDFLTKFNVSGIGSASIANAKLRLYNVDPSSDGGSFYRVTDNSWIESGVTWNNAPAASATLIGSLGSVSSGSWYEVDVSSVISGDGMYSFRTKSTSSNGADYSSKEGANAPQLVVTVTDTGGKTGDINGDGVVNIFDASILASKWGTADPDADLNGNGVVDIFDASIMATNWDG